MYKYFLIISFIMLALGPPGAIQKAIAGDITQECLCTPGWDHILHQYNLVNIKEVAIDTCGLEWEGKPYCDTASLMWMFKDIGDSGIWGTNESDEKRQKELRVYSKYYDIFYELESPNDLIRNYDTVKIEDINSKYTNFKNFLMNIEKNFGGFVLLVDTFYINTPLRFNILLNSYANLAEFGIIWDQNITLKEELTNNKWQSLSFLTIYFADVNDKENNSKNILQIQDNTLSIKLEDNELEQQNKVIIYNYLGEIIQTVNTTGINSNNYIEINIVNLPQGIYFAQLDKKIIKFLK